MPKVSRAQLVSDDMRRIKDAFLRTLASLRTTEDVEDFLQDFLTFSEWKMFMKRLAVAEMLIAGKSYAIIQHTLKVSNGMITRMQEFLRLHGTGMNKLLKRLQKKF